MKVLDLIKWTGRNVVPMCAFLNCDVSAMTPGGDMTADTSSGKICAKLSQWVVSTDEGFKVIDEKDLNSLVK